MGFYSKRSKVFHDTCRNRSDSMFFVSICSELLWKVDCIKSNKPHPDGRRCLKCKRTAEKGQDSP